MNTPQNPPLNMYKDTFAGAQETFQGALDTTDFARTIGVHAAVPQTFLDQKEDFIAVPPEQLTSYLGSIVLLMNKEARALSPAIIMPTGSPSSSYSITMLNQPYDPKIGFTPGQHFGLSAKAQTMGSGFGGHGVQGARSGFEAGHFSTVLLGVRNSGIGSRLVQAGDRATHEVIGAGVPELMSENDLVTVSYKTAVVPSSKLPGIQAFWHRGLEVEDGMARANYPNAVQLLMGSAIHQLGASGIERARRLVDSAVQGA